MKTRPLGKDGPQVPVVCFGSWPIAGPFGKVPEGQAIAAIETAIDVGLTFIDTAEGYHGSEVVVGKAIRGKRDKVFLATKVSGSDHSFDHIDSALEESLRVLGTDYVDLYQIHGPQPQWPIEQTMARLLHHRDAGKLRHIGISNFSAEQHEEAASYGPINSSQPRYSMLARDAEESVLPACLELGIGVMAHSVLAQSMLSGKYKPGHQFAADDARVRLDRFQGQKFERIYQITERLKAWAMDRGRDLVQLAIAWPLAHPALTTSIIGIKSPDQAKHAALAGDWKLTQEELDEIEEIQGQVRLHWIDRALQLSFEG